MKTYVKFCGIRRVIDVEYVNECRPDYAGFILSDGFGRSVDFGTFYELDTYLDRDVKRVGVFVNEPLENILHRGYNEALDVIQLHGGEDGNYIKELRGIFPGEIWKAVRAKCPEDIEKANRLPCGRLLIDSYSENAYGGTGKRLDAETVKNARITKPFLIAGGLSAENIADIIGDVKPYGVDLSSGIETDGFKDLRKMKNIIRILKEDNLR
ncbi:MAG: phosphoribosylanthranilate isomerase [Prevotella sp.]|nr:phosphoribosylanthranilate isomerase [Prevotella sp.]